MTYLKDSNISPFRQASKNRRFQDVLQQLEQAIIDERFCSGDSLPSERDLKEMFNISRNTLREALRVLEDRGLIEIKVGVKGGAIVKKLSTKKVSETLALLIRFQTVSLESLAEFRQGVEGDAASLAAQRASDKDIERLKTIATKARICIGSGQNDQKTFLEFDEQFHIELAQISRNPVYYLVIKSIHSNIHSYYEKYLLDNDYKFDDAELQNNCQYFDDVIEAIESNKIQEAKVLSQIHVLRHSRKRRFAIDKAREP